MCKPFKCYLILCLCLLHCNFTYAEHHSDDADAVFDYHWGRGVTITPANLNIGGYFQASYSNPENRLDKVSLNDFSLFITWSPHDRIRFFAEIDEQNWLTSRGEADFVDSLSIERLYVDFLLTQSTSLRFGKFLTPFGRWNVIHSAPLVWTTNRPIITGNLSFAWRANGLLLSHSHVINDHNLDVAVYLDDTTDLEPKSNNTIFDKAIGARINYEVTEQLQVGTSYLAYQKLADLGLPTHHVFGLDAMWQNQGYEVLFESQYHIRDNVEQTTRLEEKGLFIQGVVPLGGHVSAVGRYEYFNSNVYLFDFNSNEKTTHIGVTGLAWRPWVPLVVKSEYRFGSNNKVIATSGLYLSVAMFF